MAIFNSELFVYQRVSLTNWGFMRFPKMGKPPKPWVSILKLSNFGWFGVPPPNGFEFNDFLAGNILDSSGFHPYFWKCTVYIVMFCISSSNHPVHVNIIQLGGFACLCKKKPQAYRDPERISHISHVSGSTLGVPHPCMAWGYMFFSFDGLISYATQKACFLMNSVVKSWCLL